MPVLTLKSSAQIVTTKFCDQRLQIMKIPQRLYSTSLLRGSTIPHQAIPANKITQNPE
jgi:hypothetical protein